MSDGCTWRSNGRHSRTLPMLKLQVKYCTIIWLYTKGIKKLEIPAQNIYPINDFIFIPRAEILMGAS